MALSSLLLIRSVKVSLLDNNNKFQRHKNPEWQTHSELSGDWQLRLLGSVVQE